MKIHLFVLLWIAKKNFVSKHTIILICMLCNGLIFTQITKLVNKNSIKCFDSNLIVVKHLSFLKWTEGVTNKVRLVYAAFLWEMGNLLCANWLSSLKNNIWFAKYVYKNCHGFWVLLPFSKYLDQIWLILTNFYQNESLFKSYRQ